MLTAPLQPGEASFGIVSPIAKLDHLDLWGVSTSAIEERARFEIGDQNEEFNPFKAHVDAAEI
jgi:hypothetical protein